MTADLVEKVRDVRSIQGSDGNWNYSAYMRGMFNGLELALSILEGERDPQYRDAPAGGYLGDGETPAEPERTITGPEHYREGVRLLAAAADRAAEDRAYGEAHPADFLIGQLATRAKAHFAAAQVAATAAAVHPGSVAWQEAIGT